MLSPTPKIQEKKALIIGFALILVVVLFMFFRPLFKKNQLSDSELSSQKEVQEYPQISFSELQDKIRNNEDLLVIDIRGSDYYGAEHIVDSVNISIDELEKINLGTDSDKLTVVLSEGTESEKQLEAQALKIIENKGFKNVKALQGGMISWKNNYGQTISWGDPYSFVDQSKTTFILPEDLKKNISDGALIYVLDVREASSYSNGHIPSAANVPLNDLEKKRNEIPMSRSIVVYGESELESFQAGVKLYDLNFLSVQVLQGGFSAWKNKKLEVVK
jgi:rhodanese-related sulfurtransferase